MIFVNGVIAMGFSERLRAVIWTEEYSTTGFAKKVGISRAQLFNYIANKSTPTLVFLINLKREFSWIDLNWLVIGEYNADYKSIPQMTAARIQESFFEDENKRLNNPEYQLQMEKLRKSIIEFRASGKIEEH